MTFIPGTMVPIGAVVQQQQQMAQKRRNQTAFLLLCVGHSGLAHQVDHADDAGPTAKEK